MNDHLDGYRHGYEVGYEAGRDGGLTRAREAVEALGHEVDCINPHEDGLPCIHDQVKSAIDALREGR